MLISKLINVLSIDGERFLLDRDIAGIAHDSRNVKQDFLFVAINGHKLDGRSFIPEALEKGAVAIVTEEKIDAPLISSNNKPAAQIVVKDCRKALSVLSHHFFGRPSRKIKVTGVTGTNGKTTTTYIIKSILDSANSSNLSASNPSRRNMTGLIGTIKYMIGDKILPAKETTPESIELQRLLAEMADINIERAVMEVSSQALVQRRVDDVDFFSAVFTNLTPEHLDYHKDFEDYRKAKSMLFESLGRDSFAVLNADDEAGQYFAKRTKAEVVWYGVKNKGDVSCDVIDFLPDSTIVSISYGNNEIKANLPIVGLHNVYNALAAIANCVVSGLELETICEGICSFRTAPGRLERVDCGQDFNVFIDYAHTAHALESALLALNQSRINGNRILLVFGCGGDRDRAKRPAMGSIADKLADKLWITNDNPRSEAPEDIIAEIAKGISSGERFYAQPDRKTAIIEAIADAKRDDMVLIAGKGHETLQITGGETLPFSDKEVAKMALANILFSRN